MINSDFHNILGPYLLEKLAKFINAKICNANNDVGYKLMKNLSEIISKNLISSNNKVLKLTTAFSLLIDQ